MIQIIQEWLINSLGLILDLKKIDFGKKVKDGYFICQVLCGFNVISEEELSLIKQTEDKEEARSNFMNYVLIWLGRLDITLKDAEVENLLDGYGRDAMNLFYELHLALQNKSKLHMITQKRTLQKIKPPNQKFELKKVKESELDDFILELNPHCQPLIENKEIIKWHRDQLEALKRQCEESREEYLRYFNIRRNEKLPSLTCNCEVKCACPKQDARRNKVDFPEEASQDFTYQELVDKYKKSKEEKMHIPNMDEAKRVVKSLKTKKLERKEKENEKMRLHTELCEEFWNEMVKNQEKVIDELIDEKITSTSFYEKQMINKMFQVKHQQDVIKENRNFVSEEIMKQKEDDTMQKRYMEMRLSNECVCDYIYEKQRIKELHRKIYAEKQKLKKARIEKICRETANDLVNLALRIGEFKDNYKEDPIRRRYDDWVSLFLKCGPILPVVVPTEDIVQDLSDLSEREEPLFFEEIVRQEIIDTKDFEKYHKNEWPWELKNLSGFQVDLKLIERGMNIIGYIVHRLLMAKYPIMPVMPKPNFKFEYAVCIDGLSDTTVPGKLQSLLSYKDIEVFEVLDAVNYCLDQYSKEQKSEEKDDVQSIDMEQVMEKKTKNEHKKLSKGKKGKKTKTEEKSGSDLSFNEEVALPPIMNKRIQTPSVYPSDDVKMSHAASLGEIAQNSLRIGEPLTDYLLAAIIVEYLHSISEKKGWALVNYPTNYNQAIALEENTSSKPLSKNLNAIKSIMDLVELDKNVEEIMAKETEAKRNSEIFPRPPKLREDDFHETILTAFIKVLKTPMDNVQGAENGLPPITRYIDEFAGPLEKFYAEQGCAYFMYYETFDYNTVKYLARLVIGDFSLPRKPSIELFGKSVLLAQEEFDEETEAKLPKSSKEILPTERGKKKLYAQKEEDEPIIKEKKEKGKSDKKKRKSVHDMSNITYENKQVQVPPLEDIFEIVVEEDDPSIMPGEEKWKYIEMPMSDELLLLLAKICENMENLYIEDFKQILFMRRIVLNNVQPYIAHTKNHLLEFLQRPDDRQGILHEFQMTFNALSECLRSDEEVKAELHCRTDELRRALQATSEQNTMESFKERDMIIEKHWLRKELHELTQIYLCAMQLELDRFVDTIQLLSDYYVTGITNMPSEEPPLTKEMIRALDSDNVSTYENYSMWEDAFDTKYFNEKLTSRVSKCGEFVERSKFSALKTVANTQGKFALGKPKPDKQKGKGAPGMQMSDIVRDNMDKLLEEWKTAIEGESERVIFRIRLLKRDSEDRFREMTSKIREMMNEVYGLIRRRYNNEQSSIEHLCDIIASAIENETPIQIELLIDRDQFYAHPEVLLFPDDIPPPAPPVKEWKKDSIFTVTQLKKLHRLLLDIAPNGIIPERQFIFILQDMIVHDIEDGEEPLVPDLWRQLTTLELEKVFTELFAKSEVIHWKDFIIFNLMIPMPSPEQLIELKRLFQKKDKAHSENIPVKEFSTFKFWFEDSLFGRSVESDRIRLNLMKEFICDLYKVNEHIVNYSAMLVDFCKDHNGTIGFAKLLGLILDRPVCWDSYIGKGFVQYQIQQRAVHEKAVKEREEEIIQDTKIANEILNDIADDTVHKCDSVVISDLVDSTETMSILGESCADPCICELKCYCGDKPEVAFSNVPIAFEQCFDPSFVYFLDIETILAAEAALLHWHSQVQNIDGKSFRQKAEEIYNECRNPSFNNSVLAHEFLNHQKFTKLLANTTRFTDKNPSSYIQNLIKFRK